MTLMLVAGLCGACNASGDPLTALEAEEGPSPTAAEDDDLGSVSILVTAQGTGEQGPYADVVILNGSDHSVSYGAEFSLARLDGERFQELDVLGTVPGAVYTVGPGEQHLLRRVGPIVLNGKVQPLPAGHYRYRLDPTSIPVLETQFTVP